MGKSQLTLGMTLAMCVVTGACSTESDVQRGENPSTASSGGGDDGAGASGSGPGALNGDQGNGDENGANNAGSTTAGDDGDDAGAPMVCEPGPTQGNSVLLIGDSYLDLNNKNFGTELQRLAKAAGALGASDKYTDRSISGTQMVGGFLGAPIPQQYANENNSDGHVTTVIMDGGGNDVLLGQRSCIDREAPPANQDCVKTITAAMAAAKTLLAKMADDGVENVVYFFYPHLPGGGLGGNKELSNKTLDYAIPLVKQTCEEAPLNCVFVDSRGLFGDAPEDFQDGIHPIVENNNKIAGAVWQAMQRECIAQ